MTDLHPHMMKSTDKSSICKQNGSGKTVAQLQEDSGITILQASSTPEEIINAINKFIALTANKDPVWKGVAKSEMAKFLKEIGVRGATELLNKAFGNSQKGANAGNGQEILFDDPEPWPDPVDGKELLDQISATIQRFVVLPSGGCETLALWVLFSWLHDAFNISPILDFRSPTKRCGKTTGLRVMSRLVPKPLIAANISTASLFRSLEYFRPTLVIDEVDTFLRFNEEIHGVLNAGHERDCAFVLRVEGDNLEPKRFCVWGPKVLAGIGRRKDTLQDRSIAITMKRKGTHEKVEKLRRNKLHIFHELKQKAARWAEDNFEKAQTMEPTLPDGLDDRAVDNWTPLFIVAEIAGGPWPERARETALIMSGSEDFGDAVGEILLADIKYYFQENMTDRVSSEDLEKHLVGLEDRPWPEYRGGKPISKTGVARILKPFGVQPKTIRLKNGKTLKGYLLSHFDDTFSRYLPDTGFQTVTPYTPLEDKAFDDFQNVTNESTVTVEKQDNPFQISDVSPVTVEKRDMARKKENEPAPGEIATHFEEEI